MELLTTTLTSTDGTVHDVVDIGSIPQPILQRLTPIFIASSHFLYLVLLYRLLKKMRDNVGGGSDGDGNGRMHSSFIPGCGGNSSSSRHNKKVTTFRDVASVPDALMELRDVVATISNPSILFQQQDGYNHNQQQQQHHYAPPSASWSIIIRSTRFG